MSIDTIGRVNDVLDMEDDEIDGDEVLSTARNYDVCKLLGGDAELFESWLHQGSILVKHIVQVSASLLDISEDPPRQASVSIGVHEELHVEEVSDLGIVESEDSFEQDDIGSVDGRELVGDPSIGFEVINGYFCWPSFVYVMKTRLHQRYVKSVRMVEIKHSLLCAHNFLRGEFPVERVLRNVGNLSVSIFLFTLPEIFHNSLTDRRFTRGRSTCNPNHERRFKRTETSRRRNTSHENSI